LLIRLTAIVRSRFAAQDPTNIRGKLQRHNVFAEEVSASEDLVKECLEDARRLVEAQHYASDEIQADAGKVKEEWEKLLEECKERGWSLFLASCF